MREPISRTLRPWDPGEANRCANEIGKIKIQEAISKNASGPAPRISEIMRRCSPPTRRAPISHSSTRAAVTPSASANRSALSPNRVRFDRMRDPTRKSTSPDPPVSTSPWPGPPANGGREFRVDISNDLPASTSIRIDVPRDGFYRALPGPSAELSNLKVSRLPFRKDRVDSYTRKRWPDWFAAPHNH